MIGERFLTLDELNVGLDEVNRSPKAEGVLDMIVRRPLVGEREIVETAELDEAQGLVGDNWRERGSSRTADGSAHPEMQLTLMNTRAADLVAQDVARRTLAGDQLYVDLDLSEENLPAGTQLAIGRAVVEVTPVPHTGCKKFAARFGQDAVAWVSTPQGKALRLRGVNTKVIVPGTIRTGDTVRKLTQCAS